MNMKSSFIVSLGSKDRAPNRLDALCACPASSYAGVEGLWYRIKVRKPCAEVTGSIPVSSTNFGNDLRECPKAVEPRRVYSGSIGRS